MLLRQGTVADFRLNSQCSSGNGAFLQGVAERTLLEAAASGVLTILRHEDHTHEKRASNSRMVRSACRA